MERKRDDGYAFALECVRTFRTQKKSWWLKECSGSEAQTNAFLWDLWELLEKDSRVSENGLLVFAWFFRNIKTSNAQETISLRIDLVPDFIRLNGIWNLRDALGEDIYIIAMVHLLAISYRDRRITEAIDTLLETESIDHVVERWGNIPGFHRKKAGPLGKAIVRYLEVED